MMSIMKVSAATMLAVSVESAKWGYIEPGNNVSHWPSLYPECGQPRQSPIDLPFSSADFCKQPLQLEWKSQVSHYAVRNTGYSLKAIPFLIDHAGGADVGGLEVLHHTNDTDIRLKNKFFGTYESGVNREYCFDSLHFHWGRHNGEGSEHTINGKMYPLEVHLVHYSCDYEMIGPALTDYASGEAAEKYDDENVLAVIGVVFEIGEPNPVVDKMLDDFILSGIAERKQSHAPNKLELYYTEFDIEQLLPKSRDMVAYLGSLTTPPCFETVRWHVLKEFMTVSEEQMEKFRSLMPSGDSNDSMAPNFRPPEPRNGRKIWSCEEHVHSDLVDPVPVQERVVVQSAKGEWKEIAIGFMVLFAVTMVACALVLCYLRRPRRQSQNSAEQNAQQRRYQKAESDKNLPELPAEVEEEQEAYRINNQTN